MGNGFEIFDNLEAVDQYVYHYTSLEAGLKFIIPNMELRLSPFTKVNDPRESKNLMLTIPDINGYIGENSNTLEVVSFISIYLRTFQKKHKVLCFSRDSEKIFDISEKYRRIYRGYNNATLWAHYADNHKGMCLIFDRHKLIQSLYQKFGSDINYKVYKENNVDYTNLEKIIEKLSITFENCLKLGTEAYLNSFVENNTSTLLFTKSIDWKVENEFRIVIYDDSNDLLNNEYLHLHIGDSLQGIVMGEDSTYIHELPEDEKNVLLKCNLPCGRLGWINGLPYIRFREDLLNKKQ